MSLNSRYTFLAVKTSLGDVLLHWYQKHRRDLPWRKTIDPYKIWVSEIMLQQTQVQTVIAYYERWIRQFPDVKSLAEAPEDAVLKAWQGLGYYRRAKNLKVAAQEIAARHAGIFPSSLTEIRGLSGVGDYTAGAIASIAFNQPVCAVDVNVLRVGARVLYLRPDTTPAKARSTIAAQVAAWIPKGMARHFNQALMELGAMICLPAAPRCPICPLREFCAARKAGVQDDVPPRKAGSQREKLTVVAGVLRDSMGRILIQKRPPEGLMGNLWEFPGGKKESGESLEKALEREWREELGIGIKAGQKFMTVRHAYTRFDVQLHVFFCSLVSGRPKALWAEEIRWVPLEDLDSFAFPSANAKIVQRLRNP